MVLIAIICLLAATNLVTLCLLLSRSGQLRRMRARARRYLCEKHGLAEA